MSIFKKSTDKLEGKLQGLALLIGIIGIILTILGIILAGIVDTPYEDGNNSNSTITPNTPITTPDNNQNENHYDLLTFSLTSNGTYGITDFDYTKGIYEIEIPRTYNNKLVTIIGNSAFKNSTIKKVVLPNSITTIEDYSFSECGLLENIKIPDTVTYIGTHAFSYCNSLKSVTIPNEVITIDKYGFFACDELTSVSIGNKVTSIGEYAFSSCDKLSSVSISEKVVSIGTMAFSGCKNLENAKFENTSGWWYSNRDDATSGKSFSSDKLANAKTAAQYLSSEYCYYYWKRNSDNDSSSDNNESSSTQDYYGTYYCTLSDEEGDLHITLIINETICKFIFEEEYQGTTILSFTDNCTYEYVTSTVAQQNEKNTKYEDCNALLMCGDDGNTIFLSDTFVIWIVKEQKGNYQFAISTADNNDLIFS